MPDENQEVMLAKAALPPPQVKPVGNTRATLALVLSVAALGFSIYGLASGVMEEKLPPLPVAPIVDLSGIEERLQKQEERQGRFAEDMAKLSAHVEAMGQVPVVTPTVPGEEIKGSVEDLKQKLSGVEKGSAALQAEIRTALLQKTKLFSTWNLLQAIRLKLREGIDFSVERKALEGEAAADDLRRLNEITSPMPLSDASLREDLHRIAPAFTASEKMGKAEGFLQQLKVRAENLVTIRPKDGLPVMETPSGKSLAILEVALNNHVWPAALSEANTLGQKGPPEFAAWQLRLKQRAEAEAALDKIESTTLAALRDDPAEAKPAPAAVKAAPQEASP